jgi:hypothetical protein
MCVNKYGIRGLKCVRLNGRPVYCWTPPRSLQKAGAFKYRYLSSNFDAAVVKAKDWNEKLEAYRAAHSGIKPALGSIKPGTVGHLVRVFEGSPRFARYSLRTQQDYSWMYRSIESQFIQVGHMFGELKISEVTRQLAYEVYEQNVLKRGHDSANKAMCAWHAVFRYGMLKFAEITSNPFSSLDKISSPPRRQRWSAQQLTLFVEKSAELSFPSIGRCALMCMELMQRPGDILSLTWNAYQGREKVWHIRIFV